MSTAVGVSTSPRVTRVKQPFWLWEFLRLEIAPYPGRVSTVIRMVASVTLVMLIDMTFHLPNGVLGAYFALLISRESLNKTIAVSFYVLCMVLLSTVYIVASMAAFLGSPVMHFLWVVGTLYLLFFIMSAGKNYALSSAFYFPTVLSIPLWDGIEPIGYKLSHTLYTLLSIIIATGATILVETIYRSFHKEDPVVLGVGAQLFASEVTVRSLSIGKQPDPQIARHLQQYAFTGPSGLQRLLIREGITGETRARSSALVFFTNRLVELLSAVTNRPDPLPLPTDDERARFLAIADALHAQHMALQPMRDISGISALSVPRFQSSESKSARLHLLPEIEATTTLISQSMGSLEDLKMEFPLPQPPQPTSPPKGGTSINLRNLFKPDAFSNREYLIFSLRGCGAATFCYIFYNAVDWPGINASVATTVITALSGVGSSRQKQTMSISGALIGGFLISLPAQIYLLPHIDTIGSFTVFFAAVTAIAAWFATSSPRLSYFGLQIAFPFFLINLSETYFQTSLTVARDRVIGVLLGLTSMWLVFDQIAAPVAAVKMRALLRDNLMTLGDITRLLPKLLSSENKPSPEQARFRELRERINDLFAQMNAQADAVLFEFGEKRHKHLAERERMLAMQPSMRSFFLHTLTLLDSCNRWQLGAESRSTLTEFLNECGNVLSAIAALSEQRRFSRRLVEMSREDQLLRCSSLDDCLSASEKAHARLRENSEAQDVIVNLAMRMLLALKSVAKHACPPTSV